MFSSNAVITVRPRDEDIRFPNITRCLSFEQRTLKELQDDRKRCTYFNSTNAQLEPGKYDEMM
jgi:hypothetical protein